MFLGNHVFSTSMPVQPRVVNLLYACMIGNLPPRCAVDWLASSFCMWHMSCLILFVEIYTCQMCISNMLSGCAVDFPETYGWCTWFVSDIFAIRFNDMSPMCAISVKLLWSEWSPPWHSIHPIWHSVWQIFWHSIWHSVWDSIWHIFWHSICHIFWHSIWHIYLAFHLACLLTFYLAYLLTFCLSYLLTFYLAFYLEDLPTFFLAYLSGILSGWSSDILFGKSSNILMPTPD